MIAQLTYLSEQEMDTHVQSGNNIKRSRYGRKNFDLLQLRVLDRANTKARTYLRWMNF